MTRRITILGSTGSVGRDTLSVAIKNPDEFSVYALTANKNIDLLVEQARSANAKLAVIGDESLYKDLKEKLFGTKIECAAGRQALIECAGIPVDVTMAAIVGMAGLEPMIAAIKNGYNVAIANKEPLVAAGHLVTSLARKYKTNLLPVDSEHNAIFQVLEQENKDRIKRIILTASGGPFLRKSESEMKMASKEQALAHPNWEMGAKISIDSATMMNKALEVIEAHHLFNLPPDKIDVLVHPQSIIHSMVEYYDGSVLAQMGAADMKVPISHALGWPKRLPHGGKSLDFSVLSDLTFEPVDHRRFPAINMAYDSLKQGAAACIAMNAANEVAVDLFLKGKIGFMDISKIVKEALEHIHETTDKDITQDIDAILAFDAKMRQRAYSIKV